MKEEEETSDKCSCDCSETSWEGAAETGVFWLFKFLMIASIVFGMVKCTHFERRHADCNKCLDNGGGSECEKVCDYSAFD